MITYRGERFSGYNKAKRTPGHPKKSHAVLAKEGDKIRLIRFGQQGVKGAGKNPKTKRDKPVNGVIMHGTMLRVSLLQNFLLNTGHTRSNGRGL